MQSGNWKHGSRLREYSICSTMKTGAAYRDNQASGSKLLCPTGQITGQGFRLSGLNFIYYSHQFLVVLEAQEVPWERGQEEGRETGAGEGLFKTAVYHFYTLTAKNAHLQLTLRWWSQCWRSVVSFVNWESDDSVENQHFFEHKPE